VKFVTNRVEKFSLYRKYVAAVLSENNFSKMDTNCTDSVKALTILSVSVTLLYFLTAWLC